MKKLIAIALTTVALGASQAHAAYYSLVSCDFKYVPEYSKSVYIGVYKSSLSGNTFTKTFNSYCPSSFTQ